MLEDKVRALVAEALEIDGSQLAPAAMVADIEEWDSIGWLTILSMLDDEFAVELESREIRAVQSFGDLCALISDKLEHRP